MAPPGKENMTVNAYRHLWVIRMFSVAVLLLCLVSQTSSQGFQPVEGPLFESGNKKVETTPMGTLDNQGSTTLPPKTVWTTRPADSILEEELRKDSKVSKSKDNVNSTVTPKSVTDNMLASPSSSLSDNILTSQLGVSTDGFSSGEGEVDDLEKFIPVSPTSASKMTTKSTKRPPTTTIQLIDESLLISTDYSESVTQPSASTKTSGQSVFRDVTTRQIDTSKSLPASMVSTLPPKVPVPTDSNGTDILMDAAKSTSGVASTQTSKDSSFITVPLTTTENVGNRGKGQGKGKGRNTEDISTSTLASTSSRTSMKIDGNIYVSSTPSQLDDDEKVGKSEGTTKPSGNRTLTTREATEPPKTSSPTTIKSTTVEADAEVIFEEDDSTTLASSSKASASAAVTAPSSSTIFEMVEKSTKMSSPISSIVALSSSQISATASSLPQISSTASIESAEKIESDRSSSSQTSKSMFSTEVSSEPTRAPTSVGKVSSTTIGHKMATTESGFSVEMDKTEKQLSQTSPTSKDSNKSDGLSTTPVSTTTSKMTSPTSSIRSPVKSTVDEGFGVVTEKTVSPSTPTSKDTQASGLPSVTLKITTSPTTKEPISPLDKGEVGKMSTQPSTTLIAGTKVDMPTTVPPSSTLKVSTSAPISDSSRLPTVVSESVESEMPSSLSTSTSTTVSSQTAKDGDDSNKRTGTKEPKEKASPSLTESTQFVSTSPTMKTQPSDSILAVSTEKKTDASVTTPSREITSSPTAGSTMSKTSPLPEVDMSSKVLVNIKTTESTGLKSSTSVLSKTTKSPSMATDGVSEGATAGVVNKTLGKIGADSVVGATNEPSTEQPAPTPDSSSVPLSSVSGASTPTILTPERTKTTTQSSTSAPTETSKFSPDYISSSSTTTLGMDTQKTQKGAFASSTGMTQSTRPTQSKLLDSTTMPAKTTQVPMVSNTASSTPIPGSTSPKQTSATKEPSASVSVTPISESKTKSPSSSSGAIAVESPEMDTTTKSGSGNMPIASSNPSSTSESDSGLVETKRDTTLSAQVTPKMSEGTTKSSSVSSSNLPIGSETSPNQSGSSTSKSTSSGGLMMDYSSTFKPSTSNVPSTTDLPAKSVKPMASTVTEVGRRSSSSEESTESTTRSSISSTIASTKTTTSSSDVLDTRKGSTAKAVTDMVGMNVSRSSEASQASPTEVASTVKAVIPTNSTTMVTDGQGEIIRDTPSTSTRMTEISTSSMVESIKTSPVSPSMVSTKETFGPTDGKMSTPPPESASQFASNPKLSGSTVTPTVSEALETKVKLSNYTTVSPRTEPSPSPSLSEEPRDWSTSFTTMSVSGSTQTVSNTSGSVLLRTPGTVESDSLLQNATTPVISGKLPTTSTTTMESTTVSVSSKLAPSFPSPTSSGNATSMEAPTTKSTENTATTQISTLQTNSSIFQTPNMPAARTEPAKSYILTTDSPITSTKPTSGSGSTISESMVIITEINTGLGGKTSSKDKTTTSQSTKSSTSGMTTTTAMFARITPEIDIGLGRKPPVSKTETVASNMTTPTTPMIVEVVNTTKGPIEAPTKISKQTYPTDSSSTKAVETKPTTPLVRYEEDRENITEAPAKPTKQTSPVNGTSTAKPVETKPTTPIIEYEEDRRNATEVPTKPTKQTLPAKGTSTAKSVETKPTTPYVDYEEENTMQPGFSVKPSTAAASGSVNVSTPVSEIPSSTSKLNMTKGTSSIVSVISALGTPTTPTYIETPSKGPSTTADAMKPFLNVTVDVTESSGEGSGDFEDLIPVSPSSLPSTRKSTAKERGSTTMKPVVTSPSDTANSTMFVTTGSKVPRIVVNETSTIPSTTLEMLTKATAPDLGKPPSIGNDSRVIENITSPATTQEAPVSKVMLPTVSQVSVSEAQNETRPLQTLPTQPSNFSAIVGERTTGTSVTSPPSSTVTGGTAANTTNRIEVPIVTPGTNITSPTPQPSSPSMITATSPVITKEPSRASKNDTSSPGSTTGRILPTSPSSPTPMKTNTTAVPMVTSPKEANISVGFEVSTTPPGFTGHLNTTVLMNATIPQTTRGSSLESTTMISNATTMPMKKTSRTTLSSIITPTPSLVSNTTVSFAKNVSTPMGSTSSPSTTTTESDVIYVPDETSNTTTVMPSTQSTTTLGSSMADVVSSTTMSASTTSRLNASTESQGHVSATSTSISTSKPTTQASTTTAQLPSSTKATTTSVPTMPTTSPTAPSSTVVSKSPTTTLSTASPTPTSTSTLPPTTSTSTTKLITSTNPIVRTTTTAIPTSTSTTTVASSPTSLPATTTIPTTTMPPTTTTTTSPSTSPTTPTIPTTTTEKKTTVLSTTTTPATTALPSTTTTSANTAPPSTTTILVESTTPAGPTKIRAEIRLIQGAVYKEELKDPNSAEYKRLSSAVNKSVTETLVEGGLNANRFQLQNFQFKEGSVIASFDIVSTTNETLPATEVEQTFKRVAATGKMGNFTVDPTTLLFQDVNIPKTDWPPLVQDPAPVMTEYSFPDWAIGLVLAGGILFVFLIIAAIVMCCVSTNSQTANHAPYRNEQPSPSTSDGGSQKDVSSFQSSSLSKHPPDPSSGVDTYLTLPVQGKPVPRNSGIHENGKSPPLPPPPPKLPGEANNGIGEVVDLSSIYIVDEMHPVAPNSNNDQLVIPLQNTDVVDSAPVDKARVVSFSYPSDPCVTSYFDNELETWDTYM